jgi:PAS domain S-box-containing protein
MIIGNKIFFSIPRQIYLIIIVVSILVIAGGYYYYSYEEYIIRSEKYELLKAIATFKINQVTQWKKDKTDDANVISKSVLFNKKFEQFLVTGNDPSLKKSILKRLLTYKEQYGFENVFISTTDGKLFISSDPGYKSIDFLTSAKIKETVKSKNIIITDFFRIEKEKPIFLDIIAPILNDRNIVIAAIIFRVNPNNYLYPLIQSLPIPGKTFEFVILRKDGDSIVYLSDLQFLKNTALNLRIPLSSKENPGVRAVSGYTGFGEGLDYRGVKVLYYINRISGSSWFFESKVDKGEIFSELRYRAVFIVLFVALMIILTGTGLIWIYHYKQKNIYKELFTEQKIAEETLRASEERFRRIFQNAASGMVLVAPDFTFIKVNDAFSKMLGYAEQELLGISFQDVTLPQDREIGAFYIGEVLAGKKNSAQFEKRFLHKDGKIVWGLVSATLIRDTTDKPSTLVTQVLDITTRKNAEEELQDSRAKLDAALASMTDAVFISDTEGKFINFNDSFATFHKFKNKTECAKTFAEYPNFLEVFMANGEIAPVEMWAVPRALRGETVTNAEYILRRKDTGETWVGSYSFSPIRDIEGVIVGSVVVGRDITDLKQAEIEIQTLNAELENRVIQRTAQLEEANKALEAFSYSVSHDLRAPLRHISGYVDLLTRRYHESLPEKAKHYFDNISDSANQMGLLIDDLLQFSRTGRQEMKQADLDMNLILKEALDQINHNNPAQNIEWVISNLPNVFGDHSLLRLVWINLLSNAAKFTRKKSLARIEIDSYTENGEIVFYVRDNGVGFDMQYSQKLFGVFQRLHSTEEFEGTGIGLANVRRIILKHGGRTWAEAELDKGATFYFTLPKNKEDKP